MSPLHTGKERSTVVGVISILLVAATYRVSWGLSWEIILCIDFNAAEEPPS